MAMPRAERFGATETPNVDRNAVWSGVDEFEQKKAYGRGERDPMGAQARKFLGGGFKHLFIFTRIWGRFLFYFYKGVETTNLKAIRLIV